MQTLYGYVRVSTAKQGEHGVSLEQQRDANATARLGAQLQYTLACCRFAHFMQVMMRDRIGAFQTQEERKVFLNKWILNYVLLDDFESQQVKAQFPLRDARVEVSEDVGQPGAYRA